MEDEYVSVFHFFKNKESVGRCGYCNSRNTLYKNDMWAYYLTSLDYQHLIDRGWRRSGRYMYKPINEKTCCPMYTIRCDVEKFRISKSQKKVLKIINDFLSKGKLEQDLYKKKNEEWKLFLENGEGGIPAPYNIMDLNKNKFETNTSPAEHVPSIKFYYMGYYIHSCPKMKYKGNFSPSYLLCPETYTWHAIEKCLPKLEVSKYSRLEEDPCKCDEDELTDLRKVVVNYRGAEMHYNSYRSINPDPEDDEIFRLYAKIIGSKCAPHMLYVKI
ncbi:hypothetical protein J437_LFUL013955 [Ladona fulva]|uniref:arginyltransferase n=1 Tax=Ladona fulva TaxID=123851 RepID=A0A8K0KRB5_LADFU|nr:hypothetical protein J437_LFUL013955 [Ladona fulva]